MEGIITIIGVFIVVVIIIFLTLKRARRILEDWAAQNDYQILSSEVRWLRKGPFLTWRTSRNQIVYYITVRTLDGTIKNGWVDAVVFGWVLFRIKLRYAGTIEYFQYSPSKLR